MAKQASAKTGAKGRRRAKGSAWHWKQTNAWYYTPPGTKDRVALLDSAGNRIKGKENKEAAELALARLKAKRDWRPATTLQSPQRPPLLVGQVCSEFIQRCQEQLNAKRLSWEYVDQVQRTLNDLARYCGGLAIDEIQKGHLEHWIETHSSWKSPVTQRNRLTDVLAAFELARENHGIPNPLAGFKKPGPRPRLHSFSPEDEKALYEAADSPFRAFLFAAVHTGLRPFCELARMRVQDVEIKPTGILWRVYSSKTRKLRRIPVRNEVVKLIHRQMRGGSPGDLLFPNGQGNIWKAVTGRAHFSRLRLALHWDQDPVRSKYTCYSCRHTFAHRLLSGYWNGGQGCTIETLAELMGNTPQVAYAHYGREWSQQYQDPLWAAIGADRVHIKARKSLAARSET